MGDARDGRVFRHTCPQCGDVLVGGSEDAVVAKTIEHARQLHDTNVHDIVTDQELRETIRREYEHYWAHIEHLIAGGRVGTVLEARLGEREREIVDFVVHGFSNREIATRLHISERTVSTHLTNIFEKLNVHSKAALVAVVRAADRMVEASLRAPHVPSPFVRPDKA